MISTRLTQKLNIRHPIVQAGMGGVARADLAAAVSNAGGLGMLGMVRMTPDFIRDQIRRTRALTKQLFGVNLIQPVAPASGFESQLEVCIEERVPVVSLFWSNPAPFVERCHSAGIVVLIQVGSIEEARQAASADVDVIIAQGVEAGGHIRGQIGLISLLPPLVEAVAPRPVIAAGGIVDGRGLAAALTLGAQGVWVGTRFVASAESEGHPDYKKRLIQASQTDAICTKVFHVGWPPNSPHRVLRNPLTEGGSTPPGPVGSVRVGDRILEVPAFGSMTPTIHTEGRIDLMANYAGQGVELVRKVLPAAEIVNGMVSEAEAIIRGLSTKLA